MGDATPEVVMYNTISIPTPQILTTVLDLQLKSTYITDLLQKSAKKYLEKSTGKKKYLPFWPI